MASKQNSNDPPVKRGRPPNVARRESILRAAEVLFVKRGFDGATMHEIAQSAGITDSLLYRYFSEKPAILEALAMRALETVDRFVESIRAMPGEAPGMLLDLAHRYADYIDEMHNLYMLWFMQPARFEPYARAASERAAAFYSIVDGLMERSGRGASPTDTRLRTRGFLSAIFGFEFMHACLGRPADPSGRRAYLESVTARFAR